ncbi:uncharacterized protein BJ171DRAFT_611450 [Polychytrium aggregatum]|uniref:uncharacterized protein n=1 Tax=Polychytrium aggregatum TaxID=110093 RepID=UPI0022FE59D2|nr:uncharacterized protein BJ171DRAFT_611450 [Polychytrium aggregatum]KAI9206423.1 hypothetical protein BJ171DRAFT_611450 [Polychytrium aggregatum]
MKPEVVLSLCALTIPGVIIRGNDYLPRLGPDATPALPALSTAAPIRRDDLSLPQQQIPSTAPIHSSTPLPDSSFESSDGALVGGNGATLEEQSQQTSEPVLSGFYVQNSRSKYTSQGRKKYLPQEKPKILSPQDQRLPTAEEISQYLIDLQGLNEHDNNPISIPIPSSDHFYRPPATVLPDPVVAESHTHPQLQPQPPIPFGGFRTALRPSHTRNMWWAQRSQQLGALPNAGPWGRRFRNEM